MMAWRACKRTPLVDAGMAPVNCVYGLLLDKPVEHVNAATQCPRSLTCVRKPRHPGWCLDKSKVQKTYKKRRIPMNRPPRRVVECVKCSDCDRPFNHSGRHNKHKVAWKLNLFNEGNDAVLSNLCTPTLW